MTNQPPPPPKRVKVTVEVEDDQGVTTTFEYLDVQTWGESLPWTDPVSRELRQSTPQAVLATHAIETFEEVRSFSMASLPPIADEHFLDMRIVGRLRPVVTDEYPRGVTSVMRQHPAPEEPR